MSPISLFGVVLASLAASVVSAVPSPVVEPRATTTPCFTTHTGSLSFGDSHYGLNSANQMIYPPTGALLNVELQACPNATYQRYYPDLPLYGARLVAVQTSTVGANQCVTTLQSPSDSNIYYLHLATCVSDTNPPNSQAFVLQTTDDGHIVWKVETNGDFTAPAGGSGSDPLTTSGTHLVKWRHTQETGDSEILMQLSGYETG